MKKTIIINTSPRKNWNTAQMLKSAEKGAQEAGAETEYIDLYDLNFTGCRSCLACKKKDGERCHCFWKDDLSPVIDRILQADNLIIGSPIYFGEPTAQFRALFERLLFCVMSYDDHFTYFKGKINVGLIYTMNAPQEYFEGAFKAKFKGHEDLFSLLNGEVRTYAACDTLQVSDYSKFNMEAFSEEEKRKVHETQFLKDLQAAYQMGAEIGR